MIRAVFCEFLSYRFADIFVDYGWLILGTLLVLYLVYKKFISPFVLDIQRIKELEKRKKFDTEVQVAYSHRIQEARERAQQELDTKVVEAYKHSEAKKKKQLQDSMEKASSETPAVNTDTFVTQLVNSTPVVVFSKTYCPYCKNAKRALSAYRIPDSFYRIIELDGRDDCDQIQDILLQKTGTRTVPRVFIGGKCVGGADDTIAAQRDGRLEKMLKEVGAI